MHLFTDDQLRAAPPALFLDLDGTLLELAPRPDAVVVPGDLPALLQALNRLLRGALAIVSGRPIQSIDDLLSPFRSAAAGLHGSQLRPTETSPVLATVDATSPHDVLRHVPGLTATNADLLFEDKGACLAIHHHFDNDALRTIKAQLIAAIEAHAPDLDLLEGRRVLEIKPRGIDKGVACGKLLALPAFEGRRPVYFGDDITDVAAFAFIDAAGGSSVAVGPRVTQHARLRLAGPSDVLCWLGELRDALQRIDAG